MKLNKPKSKLHSIAQHSKQTKELDNLKEQIKERFPDMGEDEKLLFVSNNHQAELTDDSDVEMLKEDEIIEVVKDSGIKKDEKRTISVKKDNDQFYIEFEYGKTLEDLFAKVRDELNLGAKISICVGKTKMVKGPCFGKWNRVTCQMKPGWWF